VGDVRDLEGPVAHVGDAVCAGLETARRDVTEVDDRIARRHRRPVREAQLDVGNCRRRRQDGAANPEDLRMMLKVVAADADFEEEASGVRVRIRAAAANHGRGKGPGVDARGGRRWSLGNSKGAGEEYLCS
jgi:hypothetical protein